MNNFTRLKTVLGQISDPKMLAESVSAYFSRMRERVLQKIAAIYEAANGSLAYDPEKDEAVCYVTPSGDEVLLSLNDLLLQTVYESNSDNDNFDINVKRIDREDASYSLSVGEITSQLQNEADALLIGSHALMAVGNVDSLRSADDFANMISVYSISNSQNIAQAASALYSVVRSTDTTLTKINNVLSAFGFNQIRDQISIDSESIPTVSGACMSDFTGASPIAMLVDSVFENFDVDVIWKVPILLKVLLRKVWWANFNAMFDITNWMLGLLVKPINSFVSSQVNPTDCGTDGDYYGFFREYTSIRYSSNALHYPSNPLVKMYNNMCTPGVDNPIFSMDFGLVSYVCQFKSNVMGYEGPVLDVNRYLKPINPTNFEDEIRIVLLEKQDQNISNLNFSDLFKAYSRMIQNGSMNLPKDASENDVLLGLIYSVYFENMISGISIIPNNENDIISFFEGDNPNMSGNYLPANALNAVLAFRIDGAMPSGIPSLYPDFYGDYFSEEGFGRDVVTKVFNNGTVTNVDFIKLLSTVPSPEGYYSQYSNNASLQIPIHFFSPDDFRTESLPIIPLLLLKTIIEGDGNGMQLTTTGGPLSWNHPEYDCALFGYSRSSFSIDKSSFVKTDKDVLAAARNWWRNTFIIAASVAAVAIGAVVFKKVIAIKNQNAIKLDQSYKRYMNALESGDSEQINTAFRDLKKSKRLSSLLGTTSSIYGSNVDTVISANTGISSVLSTTDKIYSSIK